MNAQKLNFSDSTPRIGCYPTAYQESATYCGYTIHAEVEDGPSNPFKDWDCEPPILVHTDRTVTGYGLDHCAPSLTREEIKLHASEIAAFLGASTLLRAIRDYIAPGDDAVDLINQAVDGNVSNASNSEKLDLIGEVWSWKGAEHVSVSRNGYSQGAWAEVLVVATPEWKKRMGITEPMTDESLEATADLYAAWAYGDVFGFVVEDPEGEELESCWGFYGRDHEKSGLAEAAREAINHEIRKRAEARTRQIKTWIRNRVPLEVRTAKAA